MSHGPERPRSIFVSAVRKAQFASIWLEICLRIANLTSRIPSAGTCIRESGTYFAVFRLAFGSFSGTSNVATSYESDGYDLEESEQQALAQLQILAAVAGGSGPRDCGGNSGHQFAPTTAPFTLRLGRE